jgi:hypothetical protein
MVTHLFKLAMIVINSRSHWVLATEDPCTIDPPYSNNDLDMPDHNSRLFVADSDCILFANLIQKI